MNNPKSEQVLKVIGNFKKVLPLIKGPEHLNMFETTVCDSYHPCGTVHCHGGWYAVSILKGKSSGDYVSYRFGADRMATDLGFKDGDQLKEWAKDNPEIWGNPHGYAMFCDRTAFESTIRSFGAKTLNDIVDHWKEVYERLVILEGKESELRKPKEVIRYVTVPETINEQVKKLILS